MRKEEEKEIEDLLKVRIETLNELDLQEEDLEPDEDPQVISKRKAEFNRAVKDIPKGREGLDALNQSGPANRVEERLSQVGPGDPEGVPYRESFSQVECAERDFAYKKHVLLEYNQTLKYVHRLYGSLTTGAGTSYRHIQHAVEPFMTILESDQAIIQNLSTFVYSENDYLYNHLIRVCLLSINIAAASGYSKQQVEEVGAAALLADIGMTLIDEKIRQKMSPLDEDEMYEVQKHPILGVYCLERIKDISNPVMFVAYQHHERLTGVGYPKGRKGRLIHNYARIVAIADVFEAMCSERTYRIALNPNEALKKIHQMAEMNLLDKKFVNNFIKSISRYPVGSLVKLSDGSLAKVIQANVDQPDQPVVAAIANENGRFVAEDRIIRLDLAKDKSVEIKAAIDNRSGKNDLMLGF
ncbi:HD-GYP domain-containing protein [Fibrobacterota bacterium]